MGDISDREEAAVYLNIFELGPECCPPNHYDLLGITQEERDPKNIENAAKKRVEQLRRGATAELLRGARVVLKRIQRARTCLEDPQARAAYDLALTGKNERQLEVSLLEELDLEALEAGPRINMPSNAPALGIATPLEKTGTFAKQSPLSKDDSRQKNLIFIYSIAGLAVIFLAVIVGFAFWPRSVAIQEQDNAQSHLKPSKDQSLLANANKPATPLVETPRKIDVPVDEQVAESTKLASDAHNDKSSDVGNFQKREPPSVQPADSKSLVHEKTADHRIVAKPGELNPLTPESAILSSLAAAVELPTLFASQSNLPPDEKASNAALELGMVPATGLNITIDAPQVMATNGIEFAVTTDPTRTPGPAWEVRLRSSPVQVQKDEKSTLDTIGAGLDEVIAKLFIENGRLKFTWASTKYSQLAEQLRNCVLCLSHAEQRHRLQLRQYQKTSPVVLNYEENLVSVKLEGSNFPAPQAVFLVVTPSPALAKAVTIEPVSGTVEVNKALRMKVTGDEQLQVEICAILKKTSTGFLVVVGPRFRMGANWRPLTTKNINDGLKGLETALERHKDALEEANHAIPSVSSEVSSAQSRIGGARTPNERQALQVQANALQKRLNRLQQTVSREQKNIPETQSDIATIKKIVDIGNRIRQYSEVGVRVGVKTNSGEYDLLRTE